MAEGLLAGVEVPRRLAVSACDSGEGRRPVQDHVEVADRVRGDGRRRMQGQVLGTIRLAGSTVTNLWGKTFDWSVQFDWPVIYQNDES